MNPSRILDDVRILEQCGAHSLHFDFMDGHHVPRYGLYPEILETLAGCTELIFDVHLMVSDISFALTQIKPIERVDTVSFHFTDDLEKVLYNIDLIRSLGCRPLLCIDLSTPTQILERLTQFNEIDGLNFLAIHPGVVLQEKRIQQMLSIIPSFVQLLTDGGKRPTSNYVIQCDGGVTFDSIPELLRTGVNNLILGTGAIYKGRNYLDPDLDLTTVMKNASKLSQLIGKNSLV